MQKQSGSEIQIFDMNHANDPEWRENLEDIKLHGTGNEDIHLQKNFKVSDLNPPGPAEPT